MKREITVKKQINVLACDYCGKLIENEEKWLKGAFQCGVNSNNEIGTWCSEICFKQYER